jgi:hypothetical protein
VAAVRERIAKLEHLCAEQGRDRAELRLAVALRSPEVADVSALAELAVDELVLVESPPDRAEAAAGWVSSLAEQWMRLLRQ